MERQSQKSTCNVWYHC